MTTEGRYNELYDYLYTHLYTEMKKYFGCNDEWVYRVTKAWLNDASNSEHRYLNMYKHLGQKKVKNSCILDIASGCGTFVFYGLLNGIDVYGVEPEQWKNTFNLMKIDTFEYPQTWKSRFIGAVGEDLPFYDNQFDINHLIKLSSMFKMLRGY